MNNDINKSSILAPLPTGEGLGERLRADFPILSREVYGKPLVTWTTVPLRRNLAR